MQFFPRKISIAAKLGSEMNITKRLIGPLGLSLLLSSFLLVFHAVAGVVQRHLLYVGGWIFVLSIMALLAFLHRRVMELRNGNFAPSYRSFEYQFSWLLLVTLLAFLHSPQDSAYGDFELFLQVYLIVVIASGVWLCSDYFRLAHVIEVSKSAEGPEYERLFRRYKRIFNIHVPLIFAFLPIVILHGILGHAHGALSNLIGKVS